MEGSAPNSPDLRSEYLRELSGDRAIRSVRAAAVVVAVINTVFIWLDYWAYPQVAHQILPVRLLLNAFCFASAFGTAKKWPLASQYVGIFAIFGMLLTAVFSTGGPESHYYAGLILAFVALPVLGTVRVLPAGLFVGAALAAFLAYPLVASATVDQRTFVIHSLFLSGAALASVAACWVLERSRFLDFMRRHELQQARDQLAQLDKAKSRFTANVHHELRTPLTLMLAPLEGMLSGDFGNVDDTQVSYLRTMHVNGLRLLKLINNLLDLAKVESGQLQVRRARCQVGQVAQDVVDGARGLAEQKRVEFLSRGLAELPVVHADRDAIEKVVVNLVGNALKFTDSGGHVEVRGQASEDGGVHLVVADSGVGLGAEELERVFDRFAQADTSATRRHEGTGIGLSLAKELVEGHGGRIWAESAGLGHGAEMHFTLPVGEADGEEEEEVLRTESGEGVSLGRSLGAVEAELSADEDDRSRLVEMERSVERWKHQQGGPEADAAAAPPDDRAEILVVEDNADMRRLLHFVVGREFRVRVARNGREGLEALREQAPDLVLTDVMMPEMSGTELCRAIKQDPETAGIPVILVTSKAEREMKIEGLEGGADDYVTKPFHPRELLARVRSFVRLHQLQRDLASRNEALESMNVELARAMDELKQAEVQIVQADRLAAVGELAAGVAHEVNNPVNFALNAVRALGAGVEEVSRAAHALSELDVGEPEKLARQLVQLRDRNGELLPAETAAELKELVEIISEGLTRTERLVSNLRDLAGHGRGDRTGVDLRRGIESTLTLLGHQLQRQGIRVETDLPEALVVQGDPGALNQVLLNLLKNSADAMGGRQGLVRIQGRREDGYARLQISDEGPGVPDEVRSRLFEPFFTTKEAGRGSGLGLAICEGIIAEHRGTIMLSSPPGEGAVFTICLPLDQPEAAHGS